MFDLVNWLFDDHDSFGLISSRIGLQQVILYIPTALYLRVYCMKCWQMDRHKYVKVAYHGFRELTRQYRHAMYSNTLSRESYDEPDYALIDTLFSLAEAYLFMQLVEFRDAFPEKIPSVSNEYAAWTYERVLMLFNAC